MLWNDINVLPLVYDEKKQKCNILVFDYERAKERTTQIIHVASGNRRKHPVFKFLDSDNDYICEVRYGDATANALQRGLWTHTKNGLKHFDNLTNGWIEYAHNRVLVQLFSHALVSSSDSHKSALSILKEDIKRIQCNRIK